MITKILQILGLSFSRSLEQFFLTVGQNNFDNKIPVHHNLNSASSSTTTEVMLLHAVCNLLYATQATAQSIVAVTAAASSFSLAVNGSKIWHLFNWEQIWKKCNKKKLRMEKRSNGKRCSVLLASYTFKAVKPTPDKYLFAAVSII